MDRVMRSLGRGYQELRIDDPAFPVLDITNREWIHVVNQQTEVNIVTFDPKITA